MNNKTTSSNENDNNTIRADTLPIAALYCSHKIVAIYSNGFETKYLCETTLQTIERNENLGLLVVPQKIVVRRRRVQLPRDRTTQQQCQTSALANAEHGSPRRSYQPTLFVRKSKRRQQRRKQRVRDVPDIEIAEISLILMRRMSLYSTYSHSVQNKKRQDSMQKQTKQSRCDKRSVV